MRPVCKDRRFRLTITSRTLRGLPSASESPTSSSHSRGSDHGNVGSIIGSAIGGVVALLVLGGAALLVVRRCKAQKHASLPDMAGSMTEPIPFEWQSEAIMRSPFPVGYISEKQRRGMRRHSQDNVLLSPPTGPSLSASGGGPSVEPGNSDIGSTEYRSQRNHLNGLRADIEELRRIMLNFVHMESPERSKAPPEYS